LHKQQFQRDGVGVLIGGARRRIKQIVWGRFRPYGITPPEFGVLFVLVDREGLSLHEVAQLLYMDDPMACRIIAKLSRRRLLRADADPGNRRRFKLGLTARGRALTERLRGEAQELQEAIERGLSAQERAALCAGLRKVIANMDALEAKAERANRPAGKKGR
jgi:DNA-binding MarR family transcriptional regulator